MRYRSPDGAVRWGRRLDDGGVHALRTDLFTDAGDPGAPGGDATRLVAAPDIFERAPTTVANGLAPVMPPNIIAIGRNYREHAAEMKADEIPTEPLIFLKATSSVIGDGEAILLPRSAPDEVDYEAELAIVIGRRAKDVSESEASSCIFGYTCANDVSARDCQKHRDKQWARGKSFDTFCPLGPWIVTRDEIDPGRLAIKSLLNGRVMQSSNTSEMMFSVEALVSYVSRQFTLLPGTVILTGTPAGVGAARTPPVFLKDGDVIEVEIEGIGRLRNLVRKEPT